MSIHFVWFRRRLVLGSLFACIYILLAKILEGDSEGFWLKYCNSKAGFYADVDTNDEKFRIN